MISLWNSYKLSYFLTYLKTKLYDEANDLKLLDKKTYINNNGWTSWISPVRKVSIGMIKKCTNKYEDYEVLDLSIPEGREYNAKILRLLPILTDMFWEKEDDSIRIIINKNKKRSLKILIEKAINCISCGVCLGQCPTGALKKDDISIYVEEKLCNKCGKCLISNGQILRGSCIVRNYNSKAKILTYL